jgi:hypothetical protein
MVVVLDATGSMTAVRTDGKTRYEAAREAAADRVFAAAMETQGLAKVAVYKFFGTGIVQESLNTGDGTPFVTAFDAVDVINNSAVTFEATPLAGAMCDTVDIARASGGVGTTVRFLEVFTDGEENNTPMTSPCFGPPSVGTSPPFDNGSWQNLVYVRTTNPLPAVTVNATL